MWYNGISNPLMVVEATGYRGGKVHLVPKLRLGNYFAGTSLPEALLHVAKLEILGCQGVQAELGHQNKKQLTE